MLLVLGGMRLIEIILPVYGFCYLFIYLTVGEKWEGGGGDNNLETIFESPILSKTFEEHLVTQSSANTCLLFDPARRRALLDPQPLRAPSCPD